MANGITITEKNFNFKVKCFICDTPAPAFSKCTKGHTGFFACERCSVEEARKNNQTVFLTEQNARIEKDFKNQTQAEPHVEISPLINIKPPINMTTRRYAFVLLRDHKGFVKLLGKNKRNKTSIYCESNFIKTCEKSSVSDAIGISEEDLLETHRI